MILVLFYFQGLGARFIIGHYDEEYLQNMTTSDDIFFRILPQKVPCQRTFKGRYQTVPCT